MARMNLGIFRSLPATERLPLRHSLSNNRSLAVGRRAPHPPNEVFITNSLCLAEVHLSVRSASGRDGPNL